MTQQSFHFFFLVLVFVVVASTAVVTVSATSPTINTQMSFARVGHPAPAWSATAVVGQEFVQLSSEQYKGKYYVLFFYPLDFTFVCPTEILQFSDRAAEFNALGADVIGVSVDSQFSHLAWINTPRKQGGLGGNLNIPLVADLTKKISTDYGVLMEDAGISLRGLFIVSDKGIVRHITMNDPPVGRSVDEVLRLVAAFKHTDEHGEVCPAGWKPGSSTMKPDPKGSLEYFEQVN